uniref:hypothetical protein n=1 Tax=Salmonella enterica TaxID=28901 RepID=UPI00398C4213
VARGKLEREVTVVSKIKLIFGGKTVHGPIDHVDLAEIERGRQRQVIEVMGRLIAVGAMGVVGTA